MKQSVTIAMVGFAVCSWSQCHQQQLEHRCFQRFQQPTLTEGLKRFHESNPSAFCGCETDQTRAS